MSEVEEGCKGYWAQSWDGSEFDCDYEFAGEICCEDCVFGPHPEGGKDPRINPN